MLDGPVAKPKTAPEQTPQAERWIAAKFDGRCARRYSHQIESGDRLGYVAEFGWVCEECAR